jgi:hypothetical protein
LQQLSGVQWINRDTVESYGVWSTSSNCRASPLPFASLVQVNQASLSPGQGASCNDDTEQGNRGSVRRLAWTEERGSVSKELRGCIPCTEEHTALCPGLSRSSCDLSAGPVLQPWPLLCITTFETRQCAIEAVFAHAGPVRRRATCTEQCGRLECS